VRAVAAAALLLLAQEDAARVVDRYFRFLEPGVGMFAGGLAKSAPESISAEMEERFRAAYPAAARALLAEGWEAAELERVLIRGEKPAREPASPELKAICGLSPDLRACSEEFRTVAGHIARALLATFYSPVARERAGPASLDEILKPFAPDYAAAYLRLCRDRVFLTHMTREGVRGPEVRRGAAPISLLRAEPSASAEWAAHLRWNVGEEKGNFEEVDRAVKAHPDNGYFHFVRAYYLFFQGRAEEGTAAIRDGLAAKRFDPHSPEILEAVAAAHEGPLRYFAGIYFSRCPHEHQFPDLATTHLSMVFEGHAGAGRIEAARHTADLALQMLERARSGAATLGEITGLLDARRRVLNRKLDVLRGRDEAEVRETHERLLAAEWERAAVDFALDATDEFLAMAAGLLLDDEGLRRHWEGRKKAMFDAGRVAAAVVRLEKEILPRLDRDAAFGGDESHPMYVEAKEKLAAGKPLEAAEAASLALQENPHHLRALALKRKALGK
jgi:hypothetical protein